MSYDHEIEYYIKQCALREQQLKKCEQVLDKWKTIYNMTDAYQAWPNKFAPIFYYKNWIDSFGAQTVFHDVILVEPFYIFKSGWHFNKVIFDACKCILTFQNIDFIPKAITIKYKEYNCILWSNKVQYMSL